jgi:uncharacterized membrane protein
LSIYFIAIKEQREWWGVFGALFWVLNRWTLHVIEIAHIEFFAILPLILSLYFLRKEKRTAAYLLFGLSLATKQVGIFLFLIYLMYGYDQYGKKGALEAFWKSAILPFVISIPFLILDAKHYILSIFFSATRVGGGHFGTKSFDQIIGLVGIPAKLPMLGMMGIVFWFFYKRNLSPFLASALIMFLFTTLNSVLFRQYMVWPLAVLLPAIILEFRNEKGHLTRSNKSSVN